MFKFFKNVQNLQKCSAFKKGKRLNLKIFMFEKLQFLKYFKF
jgi:hypothetical protein